MHQQLRWPGCTKKMKLKVASEGVWVCLCVVPAGSILHLHGFSHQGRKECARMCSETTTHFTRTLTHREHTACWMHLIFPFYVREQEVRSLLNRLICACWEAVCAVVRDHHIWFSGTWDEAKQHLKANLVPGPQPLVQWRCATERSTSLFSSSLFTQTRLYKTSWRFALVSVYAFFFGICGRFLGCALGCHGRKRNVNMFQQGRTHGLYIWNSFADDAKWQRLNKKKRSFTILK